MLRFLQIIMNKSSFISDSNITKLHSKLFFPSWSQTLFLPLYLWKSLTWYSSVSCALLRNPVLEGRYLLCTTKCLVLHTLWKVRKGMWWYCCSVSHIHKDQRVLIETTLNPIHPQTLWSYSCVSFLFCLGVIRIVFLARVWGVIAFLRMSYWCVISHSFMDFKVFKAI